MIYDVLVLNILAYYLLNFNDENLYFFSSDWLNDKHLLYIFYSIILWFSSAIFLKFYSVYRYTSALNIIALLFRQFITYSIIVFAFIGVFRSINIEAITTINYLFYSLIAIAFMKLLSFYALKSYRRYLNGNIRHVVIIGHGENSKKLIDIFKKKELGYDLIGVFNNSGNKNITGTIEDSFKFLKNNDYIDEIYCAIDELSEKQANEFVRYASINHCHIKFIPDSKKLITKRLKTDYYGYLPILSIQNIALNDDLNRIIKRSFDIFFSLIVIIFIMSWLSIILILLIKLESKGPLFYKHKRNGLNYKEFNCYKYRSLTTTQEIRGTYVKENDRRLTKIGKLLRRTSIDELPQFINVLKGEMSVVGPRPHMPSYTDDYSKKIDKYNFIFRHNVRPGITGMAQVKGFRGEIEKDKDIINRIKYDVFYIENWSLFLDLKIIVQTLFHVFVGDKKAY